MNKSSVLRFALGPIGAALAGIISIPVMAWIFTPEDIGRLTILQITISLSVIVFSLGLDQAFVREYHEVIDKNKLLNTTFLPGAASLVLFLGVMTCIFPALLAKWLFAEESFTLSFFVAICCLAGFALRYISLVFRVQEQGFLYSLTQVFPRVVFLALILACLAFPRVDVGLQHIIFAHTLSLVVSVAFFLLVVRRQICFAATAGFDVSRFRNMVSFGLPLVLAGLATWGLTAIDKFLLRSISSFKELGVYSLAVSAAAAVGVLTSVFNTVWAPLVFKWTAEKVDPKKIDSIAEHMAAAVFMIFVLSGLFSWVIPFVLPENYSQVQYIVTACMAGPLLYALSESTGIGLSIVRKTGFSMVASFAAVVCGFFINYFLIAEFGAAGAAAATNLTFWIYFFLRTEFAHRAWRRFPKYKIYIGSAVTSVTAIIVSIFGEALPGANIYAWMLVGVFGCLLHINSIFKLCELLRVTFCVCGKRIGGFLIPRKQ